MKGRVRVHHYQPLSHASLSFPKNARIKYWRFSKLATSKSTVFRRINAPGTKTENRPLSLSDIFRWNLQYEPSSTLIQSAEKMIQIEYVAFEKKPIRVESRGAFLQADAFIQQNTVCSFHIHHDGCQCLRYTTCCTNIISGAGNSHIHPKVHPCDAGRNLELHWKIPTSDWISCKVLTVALPA